MAILALAAVTAACATTTRVAPTAAARVAREENCEIRFFEAEKPSVPFETLGKVESHIAQNRLFGGAATLEHEGYAELKKKACALGGDGVVIDDHLQTSVAEMSHLHVWATVIKLSPPK
jgi:hypothetical protein